MDKLARISVEIILYAETERDAEKKIDAWLLAQEDNDDLVSYRVTDFDPRLSS